MLLDRRSLLAAASLTAIAAPRAAWAQSLAHGVFTHGVASGDPLPDGGQPPGEGIERVRVQFFGLSWSRMPLACAAMGPSGASFR